VHGAIFGIAVKFHVIRKLSPKIVIHAVARLAFGAKLFLMICAADLSDHDTNAQWRNLLAVNFSSNCCANATGCVLHSPKKAR